MTERTKADRICPKCAARFSAVGDRCVCPDCGAWFSARWPLLNESFGRAALTAFWFVALPVLMLNVWLVYFPDSATERLGQAAATNLVRVSGFPGAPIAERLPGPDSDGIEQRHRFFVRALTCGAAAIFWGCVAALATWLFFARRAKRN